MADRRAGLVEEERQVLHDTSARKSTFRPSIAAPCRAASSQMLRVGWRSINCDISGSVALFLRSGPFSHARQSVNFRRFCGLRQNLLPAERQRKISSLEAHSAPLKQEKPFLNSGLSAVPIPGRRHSDIAHLG